MKKNFGLYLILTDPVAGYEACAQAAVDCGLRYLQLRMKNAPCAEVVATAKAIRRITQGSQTRFIVNDDLAIAIEADADGIHLGQSDQSLTEARAAWSTPGKLFGLSTHSMEQALQAVALAPDYIGVGPVFPTRTKADADPAVGPQETARIMKQAPVTAVAIGGITAANLPGLLDAGASNFCVVSAVNASPDPAGAIRELQQIWKTHCF
ncbi:thiamine phosphate synthase [Pontiella sulfatireligans]|uniref:Thiamine-phosphate synthase n=1 Tax=Pontiella sulfatireligans TaxID=2750658 RepID=A0A6C2ULH5_9BACT|nr:thiamine phosphate synthase [Pontiella sulfatireligans]VGO21102.1 Thiamine-phosphate synthase [Pontiella sulfatireligans]